MGYREIPLGGLAILESDPDMLNSSTQEPRYPTQCTCLGSPVH